MCPRLSDYLEQVGHSQCGPWFPSARTAGSQWCGGAGSSRLSQTRGQVLHEGNSGLGLRTQDSWNWTMGEWDLLEGTVGRTCMKDF